MLNNLMRIGQVNLLCFASFIRNVLWSALINQKRNEKNIDIKNKCYQNINKNLPTKSYIKNQLRWNKVTLN